MTNAQLDEIWKITLAQIEIKIDSPMSFKTFFSGTKLIKIEGNTAQISVANGYMQDWLTNKYGTIIKQTISHVHSKPLEIAITVIPEYNLGGLPRVNTTQTNDGELIASSEGIHPSVISAIEKSGINSKYTWETFIVGNANRIAHAAAEAISKDPGNAYNPLFLHGKTGVGKTHLAQGLGRRIIEQSPKKKVLYVTAEAFLNDMIKAIRTYKTEEFRNRYRSLSVLIIDDIQLISKWVEAQTEFFNTFNELYLANSQVILISDRPPIEIKNLEDRLKSRFQGGIVVEIGSPEYELRLAILQTKARRTGMELPLDQLEFIAKNLQGNVRELEGALQQIHLFNQLKPGGVLSSEEIKKLIGIDPETKQKKVSVPAILKEVAGYFGVSVKDLKGERRTKEIALARQVTMYILREEYNYKLEDVAKFVNRTDHTTVIHAIDKVNSMILSTDGFKDQIVSIIRKLQESPLE